MPLKYIAFEEFSFVKKRKESVLREDKNSTVCVCITALGCPYIPMTGIRRELTFVILNVF